MIVLDTNVVSEALKPLPDPAVMEWLDRCTSDMLYLTSISLSELLFGVALLSEGRRKRNLTFALAATLEKLFGPRVLAFSAESAAVYAAFMSGARSRGLSIEIADGQIAAIARQYRFAVATRDTAPFEAAGVQIINPWTA